MLREEVVAVSKEEYENLKFDSMLLDIFAKHMSTHGKAIHDILESNEEYHEWLKVTNPEYYQELFERKES